MSRQQQAFRYFVAMGWTPAQSAGIVANLYAESGLRADAEGDGGQAYGIAQWHPPRQRDFQAAIGSDIRGSSFDEQLAFVHWELVNTEKSAGTALRDCTSAAEAGACVSKLYERPADREGEATRRGAAAEAIFRAYGATSAEQPTAEPTAPIVPPAPVLTPSQQPGEPMPALLAALLPSVLALFAPRAQAEIAKVTRQPPDVAGAFVADLFSKIAAATQTPPDNPVAGVAALQAAPKETVQAVEAHALEYLDRIAPMLDKLASYEAAASSRTIASLDAAAIRQGAENIRPPLARNIWLAIAILMAILGAAIVAQIIWTTDHAPQNDLVVLFGSVATYLLARLGDVYGYAFGGVQSNRAADLAAGAVQRASDKAKP